VASDSISIQSGAQVQHVKLTAGLHRQIWVNGSMIFIDIHVANKSPKTMKKIEIQLIKDNFVVLIPGSGHSRKVSGPPSAAKANRQGAGEHIDLEKRIQDWRG
jgi:hypothetical protein